MARKTALAGVSPRGVASASRTTTEYTQAKARPAGADFADYCCELLASLGAVEAKRMFLGWGLSVGGLTVAVIARSELYLKANAQTLMHFEAAGCQVFEHTANGRTRRMQYYTAPESALESQAQMQPWAALAMQAAVAANQRPGQGRDKKSKTGSKPKAQARVS
jgi:DNA transformation protein and related proteins